MISPAPSASRALKVKSWAQLLEVVIAEGEEACRDGDLEKMLDWTHPVPAALSIAQKYRFLLVEKPPPRLQLGRCEY